MMILATLQCEPIAEMLQHVRQPFIGKRFIYAYYFHYLCAMNFNKEIVERSASKPVAQITCKAPQGFPSIPIISSAGGRSFKARNKAKDDLTKGLTMTPVGVQAVSAERPLEAPRSLGGMAKLAQASNVPTSSPAAAAPPEEDYEAANTEMVQSMSREEVEDALASFAAVISPENMAFLRARGLERPGAVVEKAVPKASTTAVGGGADQSTLTPPAPPPAKEAPVQQQSRPTAVAPDVYKSRSNRFDLDGRRVIPVRAEEAASGTCLLREELYKELFPAPVTSGARRPGHALLPSLTREAPANEQAQVAAAMTAWSEARKTEFMDMLMSSVAGGAAGPWVALAPSLALDGDGGVVPLTQRPADAELYNHERDPHLPGFSFQDICEWCRSQSSVQRTVALNILTGLLWRRDFVTSLEAYCDTFDCASAESAAVAGGRRFPLRCIDARAVSEMTVLHRAVWRLAQVAVDSSPGDAVDSSAQALSKRKYARYLLRALAKCACASDLPVELPTLLMWALTQVSPWAAQAAAAGDEAAAGVGTRQWPVLSRIAVLECFRQYVGCTLEEAAAAYLVGGAAPSCLHTLGTPRLPVGPHNLRSCSLSYCQHMLEAQEKRRSVIQTAVDRASGSADGHQAAQRGPQAGAASASMLDDVAFKCRHGRIDSIMQYSSALDCLEAILGDALACVAAGPRSAAGDQAREVLKNALQHTTFRSGVLVLEVLTVCVRNCEEACAEITGIADPPVTNNIAEYIFTHVLQKYWARVVPLLVVARQLTVLETGADALLCQFADQWWVFAIECSRKCPASFAHVQWGLEYIFPSCLAAAEGESRRLGGDAPAMRLLQTLVAQVRQFGSIAEDSTATDNSAELALLVGLLPIADVTALVQASDFWCQPEGANAGPEAPAALLYLVEEVLLLLNSYVMRLVSGDAAGSGLATVREEDCSSNGLIAAWCQFSNVALQICGHCLAAVPSGEALVLLVSSFVRAGSSSACMSAPALHLVGTVLSCSSRSGGRTQAEAVERVTCARSNSSVLDAVFALRARDLGQEADSAVAQLWTAATSLLENSPLLCSSGAAVAVAEGCIGVLGDAAVCAAASEAVGGHERIYALTRFAQAMVTANVTMPLPLDQVKRLAGLCTKALPAVAASPSGLETTVSDGLFLNQRRVLIQLSALKLVGIVNSCGVLCAVGADADGYAEVEGLLRHGVALLLPLLSLQFTFAFTSLSKVVLQDLLTSEAKAEGNLVALHSTLCSNLIDPHVYVVSRCHTGGDLSRVFRSSIVDDSGEGAEDVEAALAESGPRSLACWANSCGLDAANAGALALPISRSWLFDALLLFRRPPGTGATMGPEGRPLAPVFVTWLGALREFLGRPASQAGGEERTAVVAAAPAPWYDQLHPLLTITTKEFAAYWDELDDFCFAADSLDPELRCDTFRPFASADELVYHSYTDSLLSVFCNECLNIAVAAAGSPNMVAAQPTSHSKPSSGWKLLQEASCEELMAHLLDASLNQDVDVVVEEVCEAGGGAPAWSNFSNIHSCTLLVFFSDVLFRSDASQFYWKMRCSIWQRFSELRLLHLLENKMLHASSGGALFYLLPMHWWLDVLRGGGSTASQASSASACALARVVLTALASLRSPTNDRRFAIYRYGLFLAAYAIVTAPREEAAGDGGGAVDAGCGTCAFRGARGRLLASLLSGDIDAPGMSVGRHPISDQLVSDVLVMCDCVLSGMPSIVRRALGSGVSLSSVREASGHVVELWTAALSSPIRTAPLESLRGATVDSYRRKTELSPPDSVALSTLLQKHRPALTSLC